MAPNQEEDVKTDKPSDKTAVESETTVDTSKQKTSDTEKDVDYKVKFSESTRENQRILDENKKLKEQTTQAEDVLGVLAENPELMKEVQSAYDRKYSVTQEPDKQPTGVVADKVLDHKVQEKILPMTRELQEIRQQQVSQAVYEFSQVHPDAAEGTETWKEMLTWLPSMQMKKLPLRDGLQKAYELVKLDMAKKTGKPETLQDLFTKSQAVAGGGSAAGATTSSSEVPLTAEEKQVARKLGMKPEEYAKYKTK